MEGFGPATFGALNAEDYDLLHDPGTTEATVALISRLAGQGRILELAIGSGRIALPLVERGHDVSGVEASPEMVAKLREKPGAADIEIALGDMADVGIDGPFDHVFLVFNTLFNLTSQEAQVRCFRNVAKRLSNSGSFLIETFVPDLSGFENGQRTQTKRLTMDEVWLEAATHDPVRQLLEFQRIRICQDTMKLVPLPMRYAWPAEIDLMAELAGLKLANRWGGWNGERFTADSKMHVSVYRKE